MQSLALSLSVVKCHAVQPAVVGVRSASQERGGGSVAAKVSVIQCNLNFPILYLPLVAEHGSPLCSSARRVSATAALLTFQLLPGVWPPHLSLYPRS